MLSLSRLCLACPGCVEFVQIVLSLFRLCRFCSDCVSFVQVVFSLPWLGQIVLSVSSYSMLC